MDCFHDFCLACDRQSSSGPYCSQACRLADLENANKSTSQPASPTRALSSSSSSQSQHSYQWGPTTTTTNGNNITPLSIQTPNRYSNYSPRNTNSTWSSAFMLGARPTSSSTPTMTSPHTTTTTTTPERRAAASEEPAQQRSLTPSSSRSSLSSDSSGASPTYISSDAQRELQSYFSSFDKARTARKRQWTR